MKAEMRGLPARRPGRFKRLAAGLAIASATGGAVALFAPPAQATAAACTKTNIPSGWYNWNKVNCHTWHSSYSLGGSAFLGTGSEWVVCQRNLGSGYPNPAYGGHHNTWWVWTLGDRGGWGWFPETAFIEGGENLPLGNVPAC